MSDTYSWALHRALGIMIPLFILNWIGVQNSLYSVISWWDVVTHFLGGIFIGFVLLALGARFKLIDNKKWKTIWLVSALAIFIGWELYEIIIAMIYPVTHFDAIDTIHDIINDILGGLVAYHWFKSFYPHSTQKN